MCRHGTESSAGSASWQQRQGCWPGSVVTIDAIARQAGISEATLYRHFPRRAGLEQALAKEGLYVPLDAVSDRRIEILDARLRVLGRSGFSRLTMAAVAAEAGVSAALYWHFTGKEALIEALLRRYSVLTETEGLAVLSETADDAVQLAGLGRRLLQVVAQHGDVLAALMAEAQGRPEVATEVFAGGVGRVLRPLADYFERGARRHLPTRQPLRPRPGLSGPLRHVRPDAASIWHPDPLWAGGGSTHVHGPVPARCSD